MPRYFFNFEGEGKIAPDLVGKELANDQAARLEAERLAADVGLQPRIEGKQPAFDWIEVLDEYERAVMRLPVSGLAKDPSRLS